MIVATGAAEYMEYSVVFTTLPVIRLAGERLYITPDREEQFGGEITLWDSNYAGTGGKLVEKSNAQWTDSDRRDSKEAKRSWKISLKNSNGGINMLNLFGQGKDDDWVMNSLYGDDSKVRENLAAQLWNAIASDKQYSLKTPAGEYAEVVCNGEYQGIYSVGRKTDQKYLDLDSDDLLLRDKKYPRGSYVQNNYTILEGYYTEAEVWDIAEPFHSKSDLSVLDADNWVDVNLFENIMYNKGRRSGAEMYYLYKNAGTSPVLEMMPVPEDALLGITWKEENAHFVYDGSFSTAEVKYREEYSLLKQLYPDLDERIAERYRYLRENIFDRDTIYALAEDEYGQLEESGALLRDSRRWNAAQENNGTESLKNHIKARLEYLDVYYGIK